MKIFFINAEFKGKTYELNALGFTVGRETDNDAVISSAASSRYHFKIRMTDGRWTVEDLGSTNGTKLNGVKIERPEPLSRGDILGIGKIEILFGESLDDLSLKKIDAVPGQSIQDAVHGAPPPVEVVGDHNAQTKLDIPPQKPSLSAAESFRNLFGEKEAGAVESHGGFTGIFGSRGGEGADSKSKRSTRLFYISVISIALFLVIGFILHKKMEADRLAKSNSERERKKIVVPLLVAYEKQVSSADNIFRYELFLKDNSIAVTVDDLDGRVHFSQSKKVTDEQVEQLQNKLAETEFMKLSKPSDHTDPPGGRQERYALTLSIGPKLNKVELKNGFLPQSFQSAVEVMEVFAENHLGIPPISMTQEERLKIAEERFRTAERLFENRDASQDNLANAIKRYHYVVKLLEVFEPKPDEYIRAVKAHETAERMLSEQLNGHYFNAKQALHLEDYETAYREFYAITQKCDAPENDMYKKSRQALIDLGEILRKKRK